MVDLPAHAPVAACDALLPMYPAHLDKERKLWSAAQNAGSSAPELNNDAAGGMSMLAW